MIKFVLLILILQSFILDASEIDSVIMSTSLDSKSYIISLGKNGELKVIESICNYNEINGIAFTNKVGLKEAKHFFDKLELLIDQGGCDSLIIRNDEKVACKEILIFDNLNISTIKAFKNYSELAKFTIYKEHEKYSKKLTVKIIDDLLVFTKLPNKKEWNPKFFGLTKIQLKDIQLLEIIKEQNKGGKIIRENYRLNNLEEINTVIDLLNSQNRYSPFEKHKWKNLHNVKKKYTLIVKLKKSENLIIEIDNKYVRAMDYSWIKTSNDMNEILDKI